MVVCLKFFQYSKKRIIVETLFKYIQTIHTFEYLKLFLLFYLFLLFMILEKISFVQWILNMPQYLQGKNKYYKNEYMWFIKC